MGDVIRIPPANVEIESIHYVFRLARVKSVAAIERLAQLIDSEDERIALAASVAMLDRGLGKPQIVDAPKAPQQPREGILKLVRPG